MINSQKLERVAGQIRGIGNRSKGLLKAPPLHFGAPRQLAPEPTVSWWYVPVFIEPGAVHQKMLDDCSVYLVPVGGANQPLRLRWRGAHSPVTVDEITLLEDQLYLVPIAARKESGQGASAILTTAQFLAQGKAKWAAPVGKSQWKLRVKSGERHWDSPQAYALNVPAAQTSNGHFTFELQYDRFD